MRMFALNLLCCSLWVLSAFPLKGEEENTAPFIRTEARYTTPRGIGYKKGYTTLEGFLAPKEFFRDSWVPFLDLRGHIFDNGKVAANAGTGLRYLSCRRLWGINAYYDYRNTQRQHYNQVAAGLESLGTVWDFRLNGYLPVGSKRSPHYGAKFYRFDGNSLQIKYKKDFALKGANAEVGYHWDLFDEAPLYLAAGPYYLSGKGKTAWGGELRAVVELWNRHVRLEGNTSYDPYFKWIGQGQISLSFELGRKGECKPVSCSGLLTRAQQRVDRNEIIPIGAQKIVKSAINPTTGDPWVFWFVNNLSHSAGTYQSPYNTLAAAQLASSPNQAIYVYPGDGTTTGMDAGIALQNGQQLLGASTPHPIPTTRGTITIPFLASSMPNITNTANVVTLANNNTVSGFTITVNTNETSGLAGSGTVNLTSSQNYFVTNGMNTTNGIYVLNPSGQITDTNSSFNGYSNNDGTTSNGNGIFLDLRSGTLNTLMVSGSTFENIANNMGGNGGNGILVQPGGGTINNYFVSNSYFNNIYSPGGGFNSGITLNYTTVSATNEVNVSNCLFNALSQGAVGISVQDSINNPRSTCENIFCSNNSFTNGDSSVNSVTGINSSELTNTLVSYRNIFYPPAPGAFNGPFGISFNNTTNTFVSFEDQFLGTYVATGIVSYNTNPYKVNNMIIKGALFDGISPRTGDLGQGIEIGFGSTVNQLYCYNTVFKNISGGCSGLLNTSNTVNHLNFYGNFISGISGGSRGLANTDKVGYSKVSAVNCVDNTFNLIQDTSNGILLSLNAPSNANISNNSFSSSTATTNGYGANISTIAGGNLCLEFTNNTALPTNSPAPYLFVDTAGTFNYADVSNNTGTISTSGVVPKASCTFP